MKLLATEKQIKDKFESALDKLEIARAKFEELCQSLTEVPETAEE